MKLVYSTKILKNLTLNLKKQNGRNNQGKITVRHKGGGLKKRYNLVDYTKFFMNLSGIVLIIIFMIPLDLLYFFNNV